MGRKEMRGRGDDDINGVALFHKEAKMSRMISFVGDGCKKIITKHPKVCAHYRHESRQS